MISEIESPTITPSKSEVLWKWMQGQGLYSKDLNEFDQEFNSTENAYTLWQDLKPRLAEQFKGDVDGFTNFQNEYHLGKAEEFKPMELDQSKKEKGVLPAEAEDATPSTTSVSTSEDALSEFTSTKDNLELKRTNLTAGYDKDLKEKKIDDYYYAARIREVEKEYASGLETAQRLYNEKKALVDKKIYNPQVTFSTTDKDGNTVQKKTGLHSIFLAEPGEKTSKKGDNLLNQKLELIKENTIPILENHYPGYKFRMAERQGGANFSRYLEVETPDYNIHEGKGDRKVFHLGEEGGDVSKVKTDLIKFINETGYINENDVIHKLADVGDISKNVFNKPYNPDDIKQGGVALNKNQYNDLSNLGGYVETETEFGKVRDFVYNPTLFKTPRQLLAEDMVEEGLLTADEAKDPYATVVAEKMLKIIRDPEQDWYSSMNNREGHFEFDNVLVKMAINEVQEGEQFVGTQYNIAYTNTDMVEIAGHPDDFGGNVLDMSKLYKEAQTNLNIWRNQQNLKPATDQDIKTYLARQLYEQDRSLYLDANMNNYLSNASKEERANILDFSLMTADANLNQAQGLQALNKFELEEFENPNSESNLLINYFDEIYNSTSKDFNINGPGEVVQFKNGKKVKKELFDKYQQAIEGQKSRFKGITERRQRVWDLQDESGDVEASWELLQKDYDVWRKSFATIGGMFMDIGAGITYLGAKAAKYSGVAAPAFWVGGALEEMGIDDDVNIFKDFFEGYDETIENAAQQYLEWRDEAKASYKRDVGFHGDKYGNQSAWNGNFGEFVAQEISTQIPIIATMIATGGTAAPWVIGAYTAGDHWMRADVEDRISGIQRNEFLQGAAAIGYGAAEGVFEALTTVPILKRGGSLIERMGKESVLDYRTGMKMFYKEKLPMIPLEGASEMLGESMTQMTQNLIDGRPVMEGVDHAAFSGGMFGMGMSTAPVLYGSVARTFSDYNTLQEFRDITGNRASYERAKNGLLEKGSDLTIEEKEVIIPALDRHINDLKVQQEEIINKKVGQITTTLSNQASDQIVENYNTKELLRIEAKELMDNTSLTTSATQSLLKDLQKQYDKASFHAKAWNNAGMFGNDFELLKGSSEKADVERYDRIVKQAKENLQANNDMSDDIEGPALHKEAFEVYVGEEVTKNYEKASKLNDIEGINVEMSMAENNKEATDMLDEIRDQHLALLDQQVTDDNSNADEINALKEAKRSEFDRYKSALAKGVGGINIPSYTGAAVNENAPGTQRVDMVFKENAIKNNKRNVSVHEPGHTIFEDLLSRNSSDFDPLAGAIKDYLLNIEGGEAILQKIYMRDSQTRTMSDELVMNFLEEVSEGTVPIDPKFATLFGVGVNEGLAKGTKGEFQFDFKGSTDAVALLMGLANSIKEGNLTKQDIADIKQSKALEGAREKKAEREKIEKVVKTVKKAKEDTGKLSGVSETAAEKQQRRDLREEDIKEMYDLYAWDKNQEQWEDFLETDEGRKVLDKIIKPYEIEIEAIAKGDKDVISAAKAPIIRHIKAFNPQENTDLAGYIGGYLSRKVGTGRKNVDKGAAPKGTKVKRIGEKQEGGREFDIAAAEDVTVKEDLRLNERLDIEEGTELYDSVVKAAEKIMGGKLPKFQYTKKSKGKEVVVTLKEVKDILAKNPTGKVLNNAITDLNRIYKQVRGEIKEAYSNALTDQIKEDMGKGDRYKQWLLSNKPAIMKGLPISSLVAMERAAKNKIFAKLEKTNLSPLEVSRYEGTGRLDNVTNRNQGPDLYKRLDPSDQQMIDFYVNQPANVAGTRKTALAKNIAGKLGFDASMQEVTKPETVEKLTLGNPELKFLLAEDIVNSLATALDVGVEAKFSGELATELSEGAYDIYKKEQGNLFTNILNDAPNLTKEQIGFVVNEVYGEDLTKAEKRKITDKYTKFLQPLSRQVAIYPDIDINIVDYITSREASEELAVKGLQKFFNIDKAMLEKYGAKNFTDLFASNLAVDDQRAFMNRLAKQMVTDGANKYQLAADFITYQGGWQTGAGASIKTKKARYSLYGTANEFNQFLKEAFNIESYKRKGDNITFTVKDPKTGKVTQHEVVSPTMSPQQVSKDMAKGKITEKEKTRRLNDSNRAWDFTVNMYETTAKMIKSKTASNINAAMLGQGLGASMKGPIRAAALLRFLPINPPSTNLRKGEGKLTRDGKFTTPNEELARTIQNNTSETGLLSTEYDGMEPMNSSLYKEDGKWVVDFGEPVSKEIKKYIKSEIGKNFEFEHGIPAAAINLLLVDAIFNKNKDINLKKLKDSYSVGVVGVDFNDNFGRFFQDIMPYDYKVGDSPLTRWYNMYTKGGSVHALRDIYNNKEFGVEEAELWDNIQQAKAKNSGTLSNDVTSSAVSTDNTMQDVLNHAATIDKALNIARDPNAPVKKIRVFDFDDTLARTNSKVVATKDTQERILSAEEFAQQGELLKAEGWEMDFSDFTKVVDGKPGPLLDIAKKIQSVRDTKDVFVLTARSQESAPAIKEFLSEVGLDIPLKNITGLGDSSSSSKAMWVVEKAAEGYNDFYFADDHGANVKAVRDALDVIDVKSQVQQAKVKFSGNVDTDFNKILEESSGVEWYKEYSKSKATVAGKSAKQRKILPASQQDFEGLIYRMLGKGKVGEQHYAWFDEHLFQPYNRALSNLSKARINLMDDFKQLKKDLKIPKNFKKKNKSGFTNEQAVRVHAWTAMGETIPGLSKTDLAELNKIVESDPTLKAFSESLLLITKGSLVKPSGDWLGGTIQSDLVDGINTLNRQEYLKEWIANKDLIFSEKNLNKIEALYGPKYREALENILKRMERGSNRIDGNNRLSGRVLDYLNNAQGVVMFMNMRSAVLQGISNINFLNWEFNNPLAAGLAFANQVQYWKDFMSIMNSDYLVDRRRGLKINVSEAEVADAIKGSKNKAKAIVSAIIAKGYIPTQFMDSFAIASGGATWFRNKIKDLQKKNPELSDKEATDQAMEELREIAEKSQQSSDPSRISSQQASDLGRLFLSWANTQAQYVRIQQKAISDLVNRRGDAKSHVSKIVYYGAVQSLIFNALQQGLFAIGFGEGDDEENEDKYFDVANGMLDSTLRGLGIGGHTVAIIKNFLINLYGRSQSSWPRYTEAVWELTKIIPVAYSKISRIKQAAWQFDSKKRRQEMIDKGFDIDNPAYGATAKVISAVTNVPLDRLFQKFENVKDALDAETSWWMDVALLMGWPKWQLESKSKKEKEKSNPWKKKDFKKSSWEKKGFEKKNW